MFIFFDTNCRFCFLNRGQLLYCSSLYSSLKSTLITSTLSTNYDKILFTDVLFCL